jgi:hypothetical protein
MGTINNPGVASGRRLAVISVSALVGAYLGKPLGIAVSTKNYPARTEQAEHSPALVSSIYNLAMNSQCSQYLCGRVIC